MAHTCNIVHPADPAWVLPRSYTLRSTDSPDKAGMYGYVLDSCKAGEERFWCRREFPHSAMFPQTFAREGVRVAIGLEEWNTSRNIKSYLVKKDIALPPRIDLPPWGRGGWDEDSQPDDTQPERTRPAQPDPEPAQSNARERHQSPHCGAPGMPSWSQYGAQWAVSDQQDRGHQHEDQWWGNWRYGDRQDNWWQSDQRREVDHQSQWRSNAQQGSYYQNRWGERPSSSWQ